VVTMLHRLIVWTVVATVVWGSIIRRAFAVFGG